MLQGNNPNILVSRSLPSPNADSSNNSSGIIRSGRYGEQYTMPVTNKSHVLADEGSYFVVTNPTPGTSLATIAALTTLTDLSPFILIGNGHTPADPKAKRIYFDYIKLICGAPGTAGASIRFATRIGQGNFATRYTSGGNATNFIPQNPNSDDGTLSRAQVQAGALVCTADNTVRNLSTVLLRPVIPVVGDTYIINFGGQEYDVSSMAQAGTAIAQLKFGHCPVVLGPGHCAAFHIWLPSQSGASSWEFEIGYWER